MLKESMVTFFTTVRRLAKFHGNIDWLCNNFNQTESNWIS